MPMRVETSIRILDDDGNEVYGNMFAMEEDDSVEPELLIADYAMTGPNRTKKHLVRGLDRYQAHLQERAAAAAAAPAKKITAKKKAASKKKTATRKTEAAT